MLSWSQALAWRLRQQFLDPVGYPAGDVRMADVDALVSAVGRW